MPKMDVGVCCRPKRMSGEERDKRPLIGREDRLVLRVGEMSDVSLGSHILALLVIGVGDIGSQSISSSDIRRRGVGDGEMISEPPSR